jgi:nucleoside recognition membrane protein YjiH
MEYLTSGFELSIPDFIYSIGYLVFLIATIQNLIANIYGFKENYGGKYQPCSP